MFAGNTGEGDKRALLIKVMRPYDASYLLEGI